MGLGPKLSVGSSPRLGEPNPQRFEVERADQVGAHVVALVRYPDATEFEGLKLLLYKNTPAALILVASTLDPHFLVTSALPKPFARFEPTSEGLKAAFALAEILPS